MKPKFFSVGLNREVIVEKESHYVGRLRRVRILLHKVCLYRILSFSTLCP